MNNPFSGNMPPVKRSREHIGRGNAFARLESLLTRRMNAVIMGPEGIGKSSFLNAFFDRALRLRMAREDRLLIVRTMFPIHLAGEEVYHYLADAIESSLSILRETDPQEAERIIGEVSSKRSMEFGSSRLQEICKFLDDQEYDITMVIDDFENFTSSKSIQMDHHGIMRDLIKKHYANYVVATNYDFNQDSLPAAVSGSFLLMEFSGNEIVLDGFTEEECLAYLEAQGAGGCFSRKECGVLREISGGVPALLRITAEAAWSRKQTVRNLRDDDWDEIVGQLSEDPRVKNYMAQWCRVLTEKHVEVLNQLMEESNKLGQIRDQSLSAAVTSLRDRGLLVPRRRDGNILEDCFDFNSDLLADHCYNTVLTVSNPHDVQKYSIALQLREMIEEGKQPEVLKLLQEVCGLMDNVSMPVDYEKPLDNEILQLYELNEEILAGFDPFVQEQISSGIRIERTFMQVLLKDYAPVYISFAKAIEAHMNNTVVPILKHVTPNHVLPGNRTLRTVTGTLMLGEVYTILSSQRGGLQTSVCREASEYCASHGCGDYDEKWWQELTQDLYYIKELRNDMPHTKPLSGSSGVDLLRRLFQGEAPFTYRCTCLHDAYENANSGPQEDPIQVGNIVTGTVKAIIRSGAFIDIGAERDAYLRISEIKYGFVSDINDELTRGQQIQVKILSIDETTKEINLTKKGIPQN